MRQQIMLGSPIQINGVQSISVSLGWRGSESWGAWWCTANCWRVLRGVLLVTLGSWPARFNRVVKVPYMNRKPTWGLWIQGSGDRQALSVSGWCPFFPAMLKYSGTQSRLFRLVTFFSLISFHLVPLLLLTSAHSRARCLASDIRQPPLDSRYAEVGSASPLIPPQEWITKWKWPQGSQVQPDQLTAAFLSLSLSSCLSPLSFWRCWTLT